MPNVRPLDRKKYPKDSSHFRGYRRKQMSSMSREEQICETCKENDNGFCDRIGRMVEDDDWCAKWKTKEVPEWKARMMNTFLAGH